MQRRGKRRGVNRRDPAWKYGTEMEEPIKNDKTYVYLKCNFCEKQISGGVKRMKEHLAGTRRNVAPCKYAPMEVIQEMKEYLDKFKEKKKRDVQEIEVYGIGDCHRESIGDACQVVRTPVEGSSDASSTSKGVRGPMDQFVVSGHNVSKQCEKHTTLNAVRKEERDRVCQSIGRFFFENGVPLTVCNSPSFQAFLDILGRCGKGMKLPDMHELSTWILKEEVETVNNMLVESKKTWDQYGCSIILDGWKDTLGQSLINILVNCPKGTWFLKSVDASESVEDANLLCKLLDELVDEVGEENVVQIITDSTTNFAKAGKMLMEKRKNLYWTPCVTHCIELMLEDIFELPVHDMAFKKSKRVLNFIYNHGWVLALMRSILKKDLICPAMTQFATAFLTLRRLLSSMQALKTMFTSEKWAQSSYAKKPKGKAVKAIILRDKQFWASVAYAVKTIKPLIVVLRMANSNAQSAMGFLYNAMDKAKVEIAKSLNDDELQYRPIWNIIDRRWEPQLHHDLHAAAYYLNPQIYYSPDHLTHPDIKHGFYNCLQRLVRDVKEQEAIDLQLDAFRHSQGLFGITLAKSTVSRRVPAEWWLAYGDETPELTRFSMRLLSLACSASCCLRKWNSLNQVHAKKRNCLQQKRLNSVVYIMYNLKLAQRQDKRKAMEDPICLDFVDLESDDEWITEESTSNLVIDEPAEYQSLLDNFVLDEQTMLDAIGSSGEGRASSSKHKRSEDKSKGKGKAIMELVNQEQEKLIESNGESGDGNDEDLINYIADSANDYDLYDESDEEAD
ncbi:PREDICTED: uncharacterized protein LOC104588069 [Nelumbo nucifera]|uniref:Uncharacterized protein LOC104588069 n=2 Tax=Nelumbo nucifera TaxID=4432 RepID=A0A1U7YUU9_NELNU|nr:PREDICTED: uncharacterized protein LOC104588069 [Nelumbo nucifera]XP_010244179.1 PREDICTED: uncharacterized protein LOC104588069 [Nelumbo nucifera]DAD24983.1 TPA_asm: hypothetical protein HUJ06_026447 [Nelumbo nucifera]